MWTKTTQRLPERDVYVLWALKKEFSPGVRVVEGYFEPWPNGMQFWRMTRSPSDPRSLAEVIGWMYMPEVPSE